MKINISPEEVATLFRSVYYNDAARGRLLAALSPELEIVGTCCVDNVSIADVDEQIEHGPRPSQTADALSSPIHKSATLEIQASMPSAAIPPAPPPTSPQPPRGTKRPRTTAVRDGSPPAVNQESSSAIQAPTDVSRPPNAPPPSDSSTSHAFNWKEWCECRLIGHAGDDHHCDKLKSCWGKKVRVVIHLVAPKTAFFSIGNHAYFFGVDS